MTRLKALLQKIVSWFKGEAKAVEAEAASYVAGIEVRGEAVEALFKADALKIEGLVGQYTISAELAQSLLGSNMSTPAVATATPAANTNVNSAIKIALLLKSLDPNLTDAAVQDATNAALAAAYPAA